MADVKIKFIGDDSDVRKKMEKLAKLKETLSKDFQVDFDKTLADGLANSLKAATKEAQNLNKALAKNGSSSNIDTELLNALAEKKKAIEEERLVQAKLRTEALENSKSQREAKQAELDVLKRAREERQKELKQQKELRDAAKSAKDAEKVQRDIDKQEAKRQRDAEKRRNQLAQESSEYYKLNKALANVRKETKDLLAEMFRMERQGHANTLGYQKLKERAEALTKQTQYLDRGIKNIDTTLGLHQRNVGNYGEALEAISPIISNINQKLALFGTSIDQLATKPGSIKDLGASFISMGKGLMTFLLSPVGLLITALGSLFMLFQRNKQTVIDFDSGLKNVSKTTNMSGKDLSLFGDAIVELSMKLQVVDATKLLEYATAAGQLGVRGRADILAFTEAMAMLETASNISGEEGASEIARMLTLVDGGVQNVKEFGDEIVNLGNNFAATEKEILSNAEQIAQNVGIYRIGRQDVLAFATATKAVGLEAELVGSTFSRTLGTFEKTIRTGKGLGDVLKVIGGNQQELQRRFRDDAAGVFRDYVKGLNNIHAAGGSVNEALERTGIVAVRDQRVLASLATNGYDVLTNAMDKVRNANGAMQAEFENGASKLENQTRRMGIAWDNFILSIEKGEGVIANTILHLMNGFSILLDTINKTFNPTSVDEFWARWTSFERADQIRDINKAMQETEHQIEKISNFDAAKASSSDLNDALKEVNSAIKTASQGLAQYKAQVNAGLLTESGRNNFKDFEDAISFLRMRQANLIRLGANDKAAPVAPIFDESDEDKNKRDRALRSAERAAELRRQAMERQRALQLDIDRINEQASRNQLSRDEQEVSSIRDKYAKIQEETRKFYADPRNKGLRVDMSGLKQSENFEISEASTRQGTVKLVEQLTLQRSIYDEYNNYIASTSVEEADKMYSDQLQIVRDFKDRLKKEYLDIITLEQTAADGTFSGSSVKLTQAQEERAKALRDMIDSIEKEDARRSRDQYSSLLKEYETYAIKRAKLAKKSQKDIAELERRGEHDRAREAERLFQEEQKRSFQEEIESSGRYQKLMQDIDKSSQWLLAAAFKTGKETVFSMIDGMYDATPEQRKVLKKLFGDFFDKGMAQAELGDYEAIESLANGFGQLVDMSLQFDENIGNTFKTIGGMVSQVGSLAKSLSTMGSGMSKAGGVMGIVGAILSVFGGISEAIEASYQKRAQKEKEAADYQIKQLDAVTKALEYQLSIIQEIYGTDRVKAYQQAVVEATRQVNNSISNLPNGGDPYYLQTGNTGQNQFIDTFNKDFGSMEELDKAIEHARKESNKLGNKVASFFFGGWVKDWNAELSILESIKNAVVNTDQYTFAWNSIEDITQEEVTKLRNLLEQGKFDEVTAAQVENIINQWEIWKDAMNQLREEVTGVSFKSLTDEIVSMFEQGKTSTEDFAEFFENTMQKAILKGFARDAIEKQMQPWYELFAQYSEDGLDEQEIKNLRDMYLSIMGEAEKTWEDIKKATGIDFNESSSGVQSESIARQLTESTGNEIVGMYRAGFDIWKRQLTTMELQSKTQASLLQVANDKLLVLNSISTNTANTVARLDVAVGELQKINKSLGGRYAG